MAGAPVGQVLVSGDLCEAITKLVLGTWKQDLVGQGHDAASLTHRGIKVCKIYQIVNMKLYRDYQHKRLLLGLQYNQTPASALGRTAGEADIATLTWTGLSNILCTHSTVFFF